MAGLEDGGLELPNSITQEGHKRCRAEFDHSTNVGPNARQSFEKL